MSERIEIITKLIKALAPIAAGLGYSITPEQIEAISYILGGMLTLAYSLEAFLKYKKTGQHNAG